jgi:hypothetical protein
VAIAATTAAAPNKLLVDSRTMCGVDIISLPGGEIISQGLRDLESERETEASLLVLIGAPRLRELGFPVPDDARSSPEHRLYALLSARDPESAHGRYNALIRRLVSFERAAECAR